MRVTCLLLVRPIRAEVSSDEILSDRIPSKHRGTVTTAGKLTNGTFASTLSFAFVDELYACGNGTSPSEGGAYAHTKQQLLLLLHLDIP